MSRSRASSPISSALELASGGGTPSGASNAESNKPLPGEAHDEAHDEAPEIVRPEHARVPEPTIERLSTYLQCVRGLREGGETTASSSEIARRTGINAAQLRKDLSYFGEFGKPGLGYDLEALEAHLARIMGLDGERDVLLVGAGNLGRALSSYAGFGRRGFRIVAAFDVDEAKIGTHIGPCPVYDLRDIEEINARIGARVGVVAVPVGAAQAALEALVNAGVRAVLNFAPIALKSPSPTAKVASNASQIAVRNVDLTSQMEILSYYLGAGDVSNRLVSNRLPTEAPGGAQ